MRMHTLGVYLYEIWYTVCGVYLLEIQFNSCYFSQIYSVSNFLSHFFNNSVCYLSADTYTLTHTIKGCYINGSFLTNKFLELNIAAEKRSILLYTHLQRPPSVRDMHYIRKHLFSRKIGKDRFRKTRCLRR